MRFKDVTTAQDVTALREGDVAGAITMLRTASLRELRDEAFLREEFLLALGLNGEALHQFPEGLYPWCGKGIRSWQYPIQLAPYLVFLSGRDIRSYVEIGCRHGGTFIIVVEYLRRFSDLYRAAALDLTQAIIMESYARQTSGVEYRIGDSQTPEVKAWLDSVPWDLAFVDGDHSHEGCASDYDAVKRRSKLVALHDIASSECAGVVHTWAGIKRVMPEARLFEAVDQYREVRDRTGAPWLGIGVVDFS